MITVDEARARLEGAGFAITEEKRLPNETGTQLKVDGPGFNGVSVNIYDKGSYYVQGNNKGPVDGVLSASQSQAANSGTVTPAASPTPSPVPSVAPGHSSVALPESEDKTIFVVHGHDPQARMELQFALLHLGLQPFVLANTSGGGLTIIEALEKEIGPGADRVRFGIVLLTPDDIGYSNTEGSQNAKPRARQNVILEMGMLISAIGRQNVAVLMKGSLEIPSDAEGILRLQFQSHVQETITKLCEHLMQAGFGLNPENIVKAANST